MSRLTLYMLASACGAAVGHICGLAGMGFWARVLVGGLGGAAIALCVDAAVRSARESRSERTAREKRQAEFLEYMRSVRDRVVAEQKTVDERQADFERRLAQGIRRPRTFKLEDE